MTLCGSPPDRQAHPAPRALHPIPPPRTSDSPLFCGSPRRQGRAGRRPGGVRVVGGGLHGDAKGIGCVHATAIGIRPTRTFALPYPRPALPTSIPKGSSTRAPPSRPRILSLLLDSPHCLSQVRPPQDIELLARWSAPCPRSARKGCPIFWQLIECPG